MTLRTMSAVVAAFFALTTTTAIGRTVDSRQSVKSHVDTEVQAIMAKYGVPGMSVGVVDGATSYVFNYGVAAKETKQPVTADTLFELGSISKTFTATLASYAQASGRLSLSDPTSKYLPSLRESEFGNVSVLDLGTHTPGGLPLQVPDGIRNNDQLMQYFRKWRPAYAPGTYRTYSNISIGALGLIAAKSMGQNFTNLMEQRLFPALGMRNTYIEIPAKKMADYAQGYTKADTPIRMAPGVLGREAYGVRTTTADMLRFVEANMGLIKLGPKFQHAITDTHTGYFKAGVMTQDLIWEQFPTPVELKTLLEGNSPAMIFDATPVTEIVPAQKPRQDVWINKTGSTNGFGAYVAFIPKQRLGIVILANKGFPIDARVTAAYNILTSLGYDQPQVRCKPRKESGCERSSNVPISQENRNGD